MIKSKFKLAKLYDAGNDLSVRWYVHFSFLHPETGKMERFKKAISSTYHTAAARRETAKEMIKVLNVKLKEGWSPYQTEQLNLRTAKSALDEILEIKKSQLRIRTYYTYKNIVKQFGIFLEKRHLLKISIDEFNFQHAIAYLDWSQTTYQLENRTVNYRRMHMKSLFNELKYRQFIDVNPFDNIKILPETETSINFYPPESLALLKSDLKVKNYDLFMCALLVFYTFIRPAEIVRLKIRDIDLKNHKIILPGRTTKNKKSEMVEMPNQLFAELSTMNLNFPPDYYVFGRGLTRGRLSTAPTRIAGAWAAWTKEIKIENNGIYALKHTGAGMAVESGMNIRDLQLQLRHHSLEMTQEYLDRFSRAPSERVRNAFPDL